jgi:thiamine monophosphate synthase
MYKFYKVYIFINDINNFIFTNIEKISNIHIIYNSHNFKSDKFIKLNNFCKKKKIKLYILDNYKLAIKNRLNGIIISHNNKTINYFGNPLCKNQKLEIIGKVHSQAEYFFKIRQNCIKIILSPIFKTLKYSENNILKIIKFNLISFNWRLEKIPLGGINTKNYKKLKMTKTKYFAASSMIFIR